MLPKVELARIRNLGETVDDSILFLKQNFRPLLKAYVYICGIFWVAGLVVSMFGLTQRFQLQNQGEAISSTTYILTAIAGYINFIFLALTSFSFIALYHEKGKEAPTVEEVWAYVKYYLLRVAGSGIALFALLALGTLLCVLPGIYFMPILLLIIAIMTLENASFSYAFGLAFTLIKNKWWHLMSALVVMMVLILAITILLCIPLGIIAGLILYLTDVNQPEAQGIGIAIALNTLQFFYILPMIAVALCYYSFTEQRDDNSLMQRIEMLGKHNAGTTHLPTEEY
nr:hypothetical protein [uncultured Mucilaginibacter sp.]